jgi:hypothetical protein
MKYEYLVARGLVACVNNNTLYKPSINGQFLKEWDAKPLQDFLNHYGEQGWDVVNIFSPSAGQGFCVVLKRAMSNS